MHDGQNVFDAATSFAGEWGVDETLDSLRARAIVVAVDNGGAFRMSEYNPWRAANVSLGGGDGDQYLNFLVSTLKPFIDTRYRTLRDPAHTGVMGSSMGGLISLYAVLKRPDVFGRAGVFSCACWVARPAVYQFARTAGKPHRDARIFFIAGELETKDGGPSRDQREMVDTLVAAGWQRNVNVRSIISPDGKHSEWFWRREFPAAFLWLFR
jgi:predicted alpha/beta superfamily hydrolase